MGEGQPDEGFGGWDMHRHMCLGFRLLYAVYQKVLLEANKPPDSWFELKENTHVYVTGLPEDVTAEEIIEVFSKCGILKEKELIWTVDLGPFKHVVDDGLELRKAAFECVDTLLDTCLDQVNPSSFIVPHLQSGLDDHYDVKMSCHLILSKLAEKCPSAVLAVIGSLVDPLQKTISFKTKTDAVKQEVDRNEDMIRSALRAISSLNRISGGDCGHKFKNLMNEISKSVTVRNMYDSIRSE